MQIGDWRVDLVSGGRFLHDGGILYGVVPKAIWEKMTPADPQNRVPLGMHCVVARNQTHTVLIDAGHGDKLSPLDRKSYSLEPGWPLLTDLARLGIAPEDVDVVILSHLHWDHAGGATSRIDGQMKSTFPKATYYVQRQEWTDATSGALEVSGGYQDDDYLPLASEGRLMLVDGSHEIIPGVRTILTGGHTLGHQAVEITSNGQGLVFLGDVAPTVAHIRRMWCTSYDLDLPQSRRVKLELFGHAADRGYWVVWNHDCYNPISRIERHPRREFAAVELQ
ncbi:MBL fold metallo-hydrolase [Blastopirellula retiformator]|uniref:Putative quorum-quenching lactonase YtnP n=1 Tax=Blastopirellula retiformator TaxID=2527970 RepID=A0A5C5V989_9BACT|nr:MBL fold metallo-hydrolase [Blastopirellula retiformator]TWT34282.1 putative quorum-quenching lactonase YtnP [Blastopirellula retiformator]